MKSQFVIGTDIGGSHMSSALIDLADGGIVHASHCREHLNNTQPAGILMDQWIALIQRSISEAGIPPGEIMGVGVSIPGPFDYGKGISLIRGVNKFRALYGLNVKQVLLNRLSLAETPGIRFENDAACFGIGESRVGATAGYHRIIAITLGTGIGASFLVDGRIQKEGDGVPPDGYLYNVGFKDGITEDYISAKWLVRAYNAAAGASCRDAKEVYDLAISRDDEHARMVFDEFAANLAACLLPWIRDFRAECLVIGGNISKASALIVPGLLRAFEESGLSLSVRVSEDTEIASMRGAASLVQTGRQDAANALNEPARWRKSKQPLMPMQVSNEQVVRGGYDLYPYTPLGADKITAGYDTLAEWMSQQSSVRVDGYAGVDWVVIREELDAKFRRMGIKTLWYEMASFEKPQGEIEDMVRPWLGETDSVWGKKTALTLSDFYEVDTFPGEQEATDGQLTILAGVGAALISHSAPLVYVDLPKNELQYRMRAGSVCNLGRRLPYLPAAMYKRFYFVDWVVLNKHKEKILPAISIIADGQWKTGITWMKKEALQSGLAFLANNIVRVRPWFEPGTWGGQWCKKHIPSLNDEEINYAWSFEMIVPENGVVFESNCYLLEISFDWLMFYANAAILGKHTALFGYEFPVRFDFLDTVEGGNLSIQCHPSLPYIQQQFGETITQDETYYIMDCIENAKVYLGLQQDVDMAGFRRTLEKSIQEHIPLQIEQFVQTHSASKHDLFLIPNGTVHSAGAGNLVLEISATPYIFTFKMYDWLRPDLDGAPRPINIEHAFNNIDYEKRGARVQETLISRPAVIEQGDDWQVVHLPTHPAHFYDVHRIEFRGSIQVDTDERFHLLMLVEGTSVMVQTKTGYTHRYHYAETFLIPAAAVSYTLTNEGNEMAKVVKAFLK